MRKIGLLLLLAAGCEPSPEAVKNHREGMAKCQAKWSEEVIPKNYKIEKTLFCSQHAAGHILVDEATGKKYLFVTQDRRIAAFSEIKE